MVFGVLMTVMQVDLWAALAVAGLCLACSVLGPSAVVSRRARGVDQVWTTVDHSRPRQNRKSGWKAGRGQRGWEGAATGAVCQLIPEKPCWWALWILSQFSLRLFVNTGNSKASKTFLGCKWICEPTVAMYWQTKWVLQDLRDVWIESGSSEAICLRFSSDPGYSGRAAGGAVLQRSKQLLLYPLSKNSPWNIRACRFSDLSRQMGVSGVTHSSRWVWLKRLIGLLVWLFCCHTLPSVKTPMHRQLDTFGASSWL